MKPGRILIVAGLIGLAAGCRFDIGGMLDSDATVTDAPRADAAIPDAAIPDAAIPDAAADAAIPDGAIPDASPGIVEAVSVSIAVDHGRLGNLTIKLTSATNTTLGLMSRPGFFEDADDGTDNGTSVNYGAEGDRSDLSSSAPITFTDGSSNDAENMGKDLTGDGTAVCADDGVCDYHPNPDSVVGAADLGDFAGEQKSGAWRLCVGDSAPETGGTLQGWSITILSDLGADTLSSGVIAAPIQDDAYGGTVASMVCHTLIAP